MKNQKPLIVRYQGKRIEINLVIEDCPDDVEIRAKLQDPDYKTSWKAAYLDSIYEEQLNEPIETKISALTSVDIGINGTDQDSVDQDDTNQEDENKE